MWVCVSVCLFVPQNVQQNVQQNVEQNSELHIFSCDEQLYNSYFQSFCLSVSLSHKMSNKTKCVHKQAHLHFLETLKKKSNLGHTQMTWDLEILEKKIFEFFFWIFLTLILNFFILNFFFKILLFHCVQHLLTVLGVTIMLG